MTKQQNDALILRFLRESMPLDTQDLSDRDVFDLYGGHKFNAVVADFGDGIYLYKAVEDPDTQSGRTLYTLIDATDPSASKTAEAFEDCPKKDAHAIIAGHLRFMTREDDNKTDDQIIAEYGGDQSNEIVAAFYGSLYLYRSETSTPSGPHVVYSVIDIHDPNDSRMAEEILPYQVSPAQPHRQLQAPA